MAVSNYLKQCQPRCFILENVVGLLAENDAAGSDADWIVEEMKQIGYYCQYHTIDARRYGSFADRSRVYFVGTRTPVAEECDDLPKAILEGCTCGAGTANFCIWSDQEVLMEMCATYPEAEVHIV